MALSCRSLCAIKGVLQQLQAFLRARNDKLHYTLKTAGKSFIHIGF